MKKKYKWQRQRIIISLRYDEDTFKIHFCLASECVDLLNVNRHHNLLCPSRGHIRVDFIRVAFQMRINNLLSHTRCDDIAMT